MWERFRKAGGKAGRPALDLLLGIRALQGLFAISFAFLALEWIRSRQLPYEFLLYGLSIELFLFVMLWSLFRLGRLGRQAMHRMGLWVAAAISLPLSVYLTLVDAGGEIRFILLLIWFLAYGRNTGILLTVLYISGVGALLLLSGKFDFFAGNDPIRSLIRASLLAASLLPLLIFLRSRWLVRSVMPIRLTHLLLQLVRFIKHRPAALAGPALQVPGDARKLWQYLEDLPEDGPFRYRGPASKQLNGVLLDIEFRNPSAFAGPGISGAARSETISRRLLEWQEYLDSVCPAAVWINSSRSGLSVWCDRAAYPEFLKLVEGLLHRLVHERTSARGRGMDYPRVDLTLFYGQLWVIEGKDGELNAAVDWPQQDFESTAMISRDVGSESPGSPSLEGSRYRLIRENEGAAKQSMFREADPWLREMKKMQTMEKSTGDSGLTH